MLVTSLTSATFVRSSSTTRLICGVTCVFTPVKSPSPATSVARGSSGRTEWSSIRTHTRRNSPSSWTKGPLLLLCCCDGCCAVLMAAVLFWWLLCCCVMIARLVCHFGLCNKIKLFLWINKLVPSICVSVKIVNNLKEQLLCQQYRECPAFVETALYLVTKTEQNQKRQILTSEEKISKNDNIM